MENMHFKLRLYVVINNYKQSVAMLFLENGGNVFDEF